MRGIVTDRPAFEEMAASDDIIYVDKTSFVQRMVMGTGRSYFISRPRRFGKSLMCSTLDALFSGKRNLFEGLWISNTDYDFKAYPVLRFDFSKPSSSNIEGFLSGFRMQLHANARRNAVSIHDADPSEMMDELLSSLVSPVIIIDEFDSAIIDAVSYKDDELAERMRKCFNSFYKVIKSHTGNIRFLFITGCTKLSGLSIFSAMNNLNDISSDPEYAAMFGYTEEELLENFSEHIDEKFMMSGSKYKDKNEFISALRDYYDGYRFSAESDARVYNPVSVGKYFSKSSTVFRNYWMMTGGMSVLAVALARHNDLLSIVEEEPVLNVSSLVNFDIHTLSVPDMRRRDALSLLYYAGYLTIADSDGQDLYLDFPNKEVEETFLSDLVDMYGNYEKAPASIANAARKAADAGDVDKLISTLNELYRPITPMDLRGQKEQLVQLLFKALFVIAGVPVLTEVYAGKGRLDALVSAKEHNYIFEFKVDGKTAESAIGQIIEKNYAWLFSGSPKPLHLVGLDFRTGERQIVSYSHRLYDNEDTTRDPS